MINLFRNFSPLNVLWLVMLLFFLRLGYVFHVPDKIGFTFFEPFARLLIPFSLDDAFSPVTNICLAGIMVLIQALLLNYLVNKYNLLSKSTFLPALMYVVCTALFTPFLILSPPLICNFLVIWMLFKLFSLYKSDDAKATCYDLGMIVAAGSLIYFPFVFFLLVVWAALVLFRPFNWREWIAVIIGFITIFFFIAVFYYLNDKIGAFYQIWSPLTSKFPFRIKINYYNYLVLVPVIILLVLCLFSLNKNFLKSYVQVRKSFQLLFFIFSVAAISFYVKADFNLNHFLLCTLPGAVLLSYYFVYAKRRWFYEIMFLLLLSSEMYFIYFRFNTF